MTTRKLGRFKLSMDVIDPRKLHEGEWSNIFHKMFVIRAQENFMENCIEYVAIHEQFDVVSEGQLIPCYTLLFDSDTIYPKFVKTEEYL